MAKWYDIKAVAEGDGQQPPTLYIYDEIGYWGVTATDLANDLKALGPVAQLTVRINSGGGEVFAGIAIHNLLKSHPAKVTVKVDGIAGSIASVISMAGDTVEMPSNAMMMIHDPSWGAWGTADDMREAAGVLDQIKKSLIAAYRGKTTLSDERIAELMAATTWMTAAEAKDLGFCDVVTDAVDATNFSRVDPSRFAKVPEAIAAKLSVTVPPTGPSPANTTIPGGSMSTPPGSAPTPAAPPPPATDRAKPAEARQIADLCAKAGFPELTAALLNGTATQADVEARIKDAQDVKDACARHRVSHLATNLITAVANGMAVDTARAIAGDAAATRDEGIVTDTTRPPAGNGGGGQPAKPVLDHAGIYARMNGIKTQG